MLYQHHVHSINCLRRFTLSFGFDEDDGFFLYTYPDGLPDGEGCSELFVKADLLLPIATINAKLLYFLELAFTDVKIGEL